MNQFFYSRVLLLFCLMVLVISGVVWVSAETTTVIVTERATWTIDPLLESVDYAAWYEAESGYTLNAITFGAYVASPVGDTLYLGFGSGAPIENDGALLAQTDGISVTAIGPLNEQGVHEMVWWQDTLHIAGSDPCCGDGWESGNHYTWQAGSAITKHRNALTGLTNVIHVWDLEQIGDVLYASTSDHTGDFETRTGSVFSTTDGSEWTRLGTLGDYRGYDIAAHNGTYYGLYTDVRGDPVSLATSADMVSWTPQVTQTFGAVELTVFIGRILAVGFDRHHLHLVDGTPEQIDLPFRLSTSPNGYRGRFDIFEVVDDTLYALVEFDEGGSGVVRTRNLQQWDIIARSDETLIMLTWWPQQETLIIGTAGQNGGLYRLVTNEVFLPTVLSP